MYCHRGGVDGWQELRISPQFDDQETRREPTPLKSACTSITTLILKGGCRVVFVPEVFSTQ